MEIPLRQMKFLKGGIVRHWSCLLLAILLHQWCIHKTFTKKWIFYLHCNPNQFYPSGPGDKAANPNKGIKKPIQSEMKSRSCKPCLHARCLLEFTSRKKQDLYSWRWLHLVVMQIHTLMSFFAMELQMIYVVLIQLRYSSDKVQITVVVSRISAASS